MATKLFSTVRSIYVLYQNKIGTTHMSPETFAYLKTNVPTSLIEVEISKEQTQTICVTDCSYVNLKDFKESSEYFDLIIKESMEKITATGGAKKVLL